MKPRLIVPLAALLASLLPAQNPSEKTPEELKQARAEKLAKPVFQKAAWISDYDKAREQAKKDGKLILAYFTRTYSR
jgi:hypothetical protein